MSSTYQPIRFGIPSLDRLLGTKPRKQPKDGELSNGQEKSKFGFDCPRDASSSLCLIGPHGTGKSVLALHLASRYLADLRRALSDALVFYISTDLSHPMAHDIWTSFALDVPDSRHIPFDHTEREDTGTTIALQNRTPYRDARTDANLAEYIALCRPKHCGCEEVTFVDLSAASAGDDWGFIHRLIAVLNEPFGSRHLVVIDAVEGLETLVGEKDAFGETTSRRARIAQMLRTAFGKCQLLFVVEEPTQGQRVPEEFVSDLVVRLRTVHEDGFDRRTVEVQKVRGQSHVRGQHPYVIRSGAGSFTGIWPNLDDPRVNQPRRPEVKAAEPVFQAYVHVMHSLHNITRDITYEKGPPQPNPNKGFTKFGIPHLDSMLGRTRGKLEDEMKDDRGLPCSVVTALVGDAGTHKSPLGRCFLYQALRAKVLADLEGKQSPVTQVAILLTTSDVGVGRLADDFLAWTLKERPQARKIDENLSRIEAVKEYLAKHIICRRFPIHNQTSEIVMHIVQTAVEEAQKKIGLGDKHDAAYRYSQCWRIRLVIDDFSVLKGMYTAVRGDPLFLPFLTFYLRREGISTLIIDTHPGRPDREGPSLFDDELRALANHHLYTWRVPFHGESRIAISAIPSINPSERSRIRELRWDPFQNPTALPTVDRGLELYSGLEQGDPRQVPLEIRLYAEDDASTKQYISDTNTLLGDLFAPLKRDSNAPASFTLDVGPQEYGYLQDLCNLQGGRALDHTLILQVDEFWAMPTPEPEVVSSGHSCPSASLRYEGDYLSADLAEFENDPRQLFRRVEPIPSKMNARNPESQLRRASYFYLPDCPLESNGQVQTGIDRVPFKWEFAFLLCRQGAWDEAQNDEVRILNRSLTVQQILEQLPRTSGRVDNYPDKPMPSVDSSTANERRASWREFLGACSAISRRLSYRGEQAPAFEISTATGESFSCLMLEIWASEILDRPQKVSDSSKLISIDHIFKKCWRTSDAGDGLLAWLDRPEYVIDLYATWLLLVDALPFSELVSCGGPLCFTKRIAPANAVASHHWYKSACQVLCQREKAEPMFVAGLPGHFSVRGDWYLGIAQGSKSDLLADRALDILSSRRGNFSRLYLGLGLPVRILGEEKENIAIRTALTWEDLSGNLRTVRYRDLMHLGAQPLGGKDFHWLWRSALDGYHRHSRILQRWNTVTILMWNAVKIECGPNWKSGFALYDALGEEQRPSSYEEMNARMEEILKDAGPVNRNTWTIFRDRCKVLQYLLNLPDKNDSAPVDL